MADSEVKTTSIGYPMPGDVLDERYKLVQIINAGGMGVIMRARQLTMDRDVAVKLLLPDRSERESTRTRFEREVHLAKQLSHPNTIRLYDYGKHGEFLYLVMELLDGMDLKALLKQQGPLSITRAVDILVQASDAISEAHARNIVHRDLKPGNLYILRLGSNRDFVKVLDFGIAKSLDSHKFDVTSTGEVSGTVAYLSPEIVRGAKPDKRADVYALGILFMEMITRRKIFEGHTVAETLMNQMQKPPVMPPSIANTPIAKVIETALAKNPDARYQDAAALLDALNSVVPTISPTLRVSEAEIESCYGRRHPDGGGSSSDVVPQAVPSNTPASTRIGYALAGDDGTVRTRTEEELVPAASARSQVGLFVAGGVTAVALTIAAVALLRDPAPAPAAPETNNAAVVTAVPAAEPDSGAAIEIDLGEVTAAPDPAQTVTASREALILALNLSADVAQLDAEEMAAAEVGAETSEPTKRPTGKTRPPRKDKTPEPKQEVVEKIDVFGSASPKVPEPEPKLTPAALRAAANKAFIAGDYTECVSKCKEALAQGETSCHPLLANAYRQMGNDAAACRHYKAAGIAHKSCITLQSR